MIQEESIHINNEKKYHIVGSVIFECRATREKGRSDFGTANGTILPEGEGFPSVPASGRNQVHCRCAAHGNAFAAGSA